MLNNIDRDKIISEINNLICRVNELINDIQNNPENPLRKNTAILDLLPMLDFYNDDLKRSVEEWKSRDFEGDIDK